MDPEGCPWRMDRTEAGKGDRIRARWGAIGLARRRTGARQYGVIVASLLRYPEIASVSLDPFSRVVRTEFLVRKRLAGEAEIELLGELRAALETWAGLERTRTSVRDLRITRAEETLSVVAVAWHAERLDPGEISLVVDLLHHRMGEALLVDDAPEGLDEMDEDGLDMGEELITEKLMSLSPLWGGRSVVACRDAGRLIVYPR